ncbi:MAG: DUF202 domain-containing protein [Nocardioidaceae bacterium]
MIDDGGFQVERTMLSWQRTLLAIAAAALALVRLAVHVDSLPAVLAALGCLAVAGVATVQVFRLGGVAPAESLARVARTRNGPALGLMLAIVLLAASGVAMVW